MSAIIVPGCSAARSVAMTAGSAGGDNGDHGVSLPLGAGAALAIEGAQRVVSGAQISRDGSGRAGEGRGESDGDGGGSGNGAEPVSTFGSGPDGDGAETRFAGGLGGRSIA